MKKSNQVEFFNDVIYFQFFLKVEKKNKNS